MLVELHVAKLEHAHVVAQLEPPAAAASGEGLVLPSAASGVGLESSAAAASGGGLVLPSAASGGGQRQ